MSMVLPQYYTPDMVRNLPDDGRRYETVHGELLVTSAPRFRHQHVVGQLFRILADHCDRTGIGKALMSPADISLVSDSLVQPDVFVIPRPPELDMPWSDLRQLLLAVEVLSPGTARADRFTKRRHYQEAGVPLYWVVDADARSVEVWTPAATAPATESQAVTWSPAGGASLTIPLELLFD